MSDIVNWDNISGAAALALASAPRQVLIERFTPDVIKAELFEEEDGNNGKNIFLKGIFLQAMVKNHNGRVYPINEISNAVNQINKSIKNNETVWGELDHPEELNINSDRISHKIVEMVMQGNNAIGKLQILNTPKGIIVKELLKHGTMGVSSRGTGNVDSQGHVSDFDIVTVDIVARPSAPQAYPQAVYEARMWQQANDAARGVCEGDKHAQKHVTRLIEDWLKSIS